MEQSTKTKTVDHETIPQSTEEETLPALIPFQTPPATFTKVDNNLTGIGFFTASSKRSRKATKKETVIADHGTEYRVLILPSAEYGLPITQDQDYWLALMKLIADHIQRQGKLTNPFKFSTAELTKILGQVHSGKNYKAVQEWADVMAFTGIKGGAYDVVKKRWLTDRTHAVDRFFTAGKELPDGRIADKNYIWFSEWQLDNINAGNLIPIELATYTQLTNNIAKNLVPHLQEWLFTSQHDGRFEKRYDDICQLLGIRVYRFQSEIERKLSPSLDELVTHGYISKWAIEPMADGKNFKLVLWHGGKYHIDRKTRIESKNRREGSPTVTTPAALPKPALPAVDENLVAELAKRGIGEGDARKLLARLAADQPVLDQIEYVDAIIQQSRGKIRNPQGLYISRLQDNLPNPPTFETSQARQTRLRAESAREQAILEKQLAKLQAEEEENQRIDAQIDALPEKQRQALFAQAKKELLAEHPRMSYFFQTTPDAFNDSSVRARMRNFFTHTGPPRR